jgi:hypothetical protein
MTTKEIPIGEIVIDAGTQIRAAISEETVSTYAAELAEGATFPHPVVFFDGSSYTLADGFHRFFAHKRNGAEKIRCEVWKGTRSDALKYALSANSSHGLPRSSADKRRSVELALAEWPKLSSRELARICAVSDTMVNELRRSNMEQYLEKQGVRCKNLAPEPRIGKDGKTYKTKEKPAASPAPQPEPEPEPEPEEEERPRVVTRDTEFRAALGNKELTKDELELLEDIEVEQANMNLLAVMIREHSLDPQASQDVVNHQRDMMQRFVTYLQKKGMA